MGLLPIPPKPESWTRVGSGLKPKKETTTAIQNPSMTTAERDALTPAAGMTIYNSTTGTIQRYQGGAWGDFGGGSADRFIFSLTNKTGGAVATEGYVYRFDPDNNNSFDVAGEDEDSLVAIKPDTTSISNNSDGDMVLSGIEDVYVDGVTDPDLVQGTKYLYFSATDGQAKVLGERKDGCFGECIETRSGAGLVQAFIYPKDTTRKWGWFDEVSWTRTAVSPMKDATWTKYGKVLDVGAGGTWDAVFAAWPCVVKDPNDPKKIWMFYGGQDAAGLIQIGVAYSNDGINFTKSASNPILSASAVWEGGATGDIAIASVFYDRWETDAAKKWKMFYQADSGGLGRDDMGYAYASAPEGPWTKSASNPVLTGFGLNFGISVVRAGERYVAFTPKLSDGDYYVHTSDDVITWTSRGKVLTHTGTGLEVTAVRYGSVFKGVDGWYLLYSANKAVAPILQIGIAYNWYPFSEFTRDPLLPNAPIIGVGSAGAFDETFVFSPALLVYNDQFLCYYGAQNASAVRTVGLAYLNKYTL